MTKIHLNTPGGYWPYVQFSTGPSNFQKLWVLRHPYVVYYESIKRELKRNLIYEYRCDERLKTKTEESTRLADTGLVVELERLTCWDKDEVNRREVCECEGWVWDLDAIDEPSRFHILTWADYWV
jgi:hypothetical protein